MNIASTSFCCDALIGAIDRFQFNSEWSLISRLSINHNTTTFLLSDDLPFYLYVIDEVEHKKRPENINVLSLLAIMRKKSIKSNENNKDERA